MKKEIKLRLLVLLMCVITIFNVIAALNCIFSILDKLNMIVTNHHSTLNLENSICSLFIASYGIILTFAYLKHK